MLLNDPIRTLKHLHFVKMSVDAEQHFYHAITQTCQCALIAPISE